MVQKGLHFASAKIKAWEAGVARLGGRLARTLDADVTHLVAETREALEAEKDGACAKLKEWSGHAVSIKWVEACLRDGARASEQKYPLKPRKRRRSELREGSGPLLPEAQEESQETVWRRMWLGEQLWRPNFADMNLNEFMLQAGRVVAFSFKAGASELCGCGHALISSRVTLQGVYNVERSRAIGNEPLVEALRELIKYEARVAGRW